MTKLSVIISASNCGHTIERAIRSILGKNKSDIECIVVVNNSTDKTSRIAHKLLDEFQGLVVIDSSAKNVSDARNAGLNKATGDVIGFCDGDDYFVGGTLDYFLDEFISSGANIIACGFFRVDTEGRIISTHELGGGMKRANAVRCDLLSNPSLMGSVWNKLYAREVIKDIRFDTNLTYCEDTDFNLRVMKQDGLSVFYSESILYNYVQNPDSASNSVNRVFDNTGKLKYLYAMEKVREEYAGNGRMHRETGLKMATLCIDNYDDSLPDDIRNKLVDVIRKNYKYLVLYSYKYEPEENLRRLRKGLRILSGF